MKLSRALFVLPTLFTLTSVFLGLLALVCSAAGEFGPAALAIMFAILFDTLDGRVARLTKTQSQFGIQIDSLADVVSFGVAPAALVYLALLKDRLVFYGLDLGFMVCFLFLATGAIRLARYNVDAGRKPGPVKQFTGLPIPGAAGFMAALIFGLQEERLAIPATAAIAFMLLLAFLMVSTVKYRKKVNLRSADSRLMLVLLAVLMGICAMASPGFVLFTFFAYYVALGLVESTVRRVLHLSRKAKANAARKRKLRIP